MPRIYLNTHNKKPWDVIYIPIMLDLLTSQTHSFNSGTPLYMILLVILVLINTKDAMLTTLKQ